MEQTYRLATLVVTLLTILHPSDGWYYNCFVKDVALLGDGCNLKGISVPANTEAENIYFPPTNINFFVSNFSSFSPALGRRLASETETVNFYNCNTPKLAIPLAVKKLGIFFNNLNKVYSNYQEENHLEVLSIIETRITDIRFVEVLTKLQFLRVQRNPLRYVNFERFHNLTDLEIIDLSENMISTIDNGLALLELPKLIELHLNKNFLVELDSSMWFFPNLYQMRLHTNFLQSLNIPELSKSAPELSYVTLSQNPWNCKRLTVILRYLMDRNISYLEENARLGCNSYDHYGYLSFSGQDSITETKQQLGLLNATAVMYYEQAKSMMLEALVNFDELMREEFVGIKTGVERLVRKYDVLKSWVHRKYPVKF